MAMFDRLVTIVRANVNDWLLSREDPEQQVARVLKEMQGQLVMKRQAVAQLLANQKRTERQAHQAGLMADEWYRRASTAMAKGDEALAKEALVRRQAYTQMASDRQNQVTQQQQLVQQMRKTLQQWETHVVELRGQKEMLIARARSAKAALQLSEWLDQSSASESRRVFERLEDQVHQLEATVEVHQMLAENCLENRFAQLETGGANVDIAFASLRSQVGNKLPKSSNHDPELEAIRSQLRE
jgi:phage shock protein A